jgi:hypothetical protein
MKSLLVACLLLVGCGDSRIASGVIVAAEGGTVENDAFTLDIAPGALAEDTTIELEVGDPADFPSMARDFEVLVMEPAGTVLSTAAEVTIDAAFIDATEDEIVAISQLRDGTWVPIEHTETSGGGATTFVTVLAPIAITVSEAASTGSIAGTIVWGDGSPVDAAPIQLFNGDSLVTTATSDNTGAFGFAELAPGSYRVVVDYECMLDQGVSVAAGAPTIVDLELCAF